MNNESNAIFSSVIVAIGTILAAIGASPLNFIKSNLREDLGLWGNVLQAGGNGLQAVVVQGNIIRSIGKEFQAIGNVTVIYGLVIELDKQSAKKIFITGNLIQALGGFINFGHGIELNPFPGHSENVIGNLLQSIGNSLQAIGGKYELEENGNTDKDYIKHTNGETLIISGSWIQAIGSVFSVIGTIKQETQQKLEVS